MDRKTKVQSWYLDVTMLAKYWGSDRVYHHTAPINMTYGLYEALCAGPRRRARKPASPGTCANHRALKAGLAAIGIEYAAAGRASTADAQRRPRFPTGVDDAAVRKRLLRTIRHRDRRRARRLQRQGLAHRPDGLRLPAGECVPGPVGARAIARRAGVQVRAWRSVAAAASIASSESAAASSASRLARRFPRHCSAPLQSTCPLSSIFVHASRRSPWPSVVRPARYRHAGNAGLSATAGVLGPGADQVARRVPAAVGRGRGRSAGVLGEAGQGELHWFKPFTKALEWNEPFAKWFVGGKTNASYNCLDAHLAAGRGDRDRAHLGRRAGRHAAR